MMKTYRLLAATALLWPTIATATSGNALPRATAEALGMADANVALAAGPTAQFINPANLTTLGHDRAWEAGLLYGRISTELDRPAAGATAPGREAAEPNYPLVPSAALAWRYSERLVLGLAFDSPHGLDIEWPNHSFDRSLGPLGTADIAQRAELRTLRTGPAAALKLDERWSVGARLFVQRVEAVEKNDLATVEGDGISYGFQTGVGYRAPGWIFGAAYTHRTQTEIEGRQHDIHPAAASVLVEGRARADILLPARLQLGGAFRMTPQLWWESDLDWFDWTWVDELKIVQADGTIANAGKTARHNRNTLSLRTGLKWEYTPHTTLHAGLGYDPTPVAERDASPTVNVLRKTRAAVGFERRFERGLRVALAYQYIRGETRAISETDMDNGTGTEGLYEGKYSSSTQVLGASLGGEF